LGKCGGRRRCSAGRVARIQVRQRGWGGAIGRIASSRCGATPVAVRWRRQGKKEEEQRWLAHGARWSAKEGKKKGEAGGLCWATEMGC
jgi:hypothetical protein